MNGAEAASAPNNPLDVMMEAVEKQQKEGGGSKNNNTDDEPTLEGETDENTNNKVNNN
eukprot:CAMPEP_0201701646 /NCGR_PEP_ID=MMETSP0578-20130828/33456_1 /ASSEMBLY_ACC=CAM_ASM_000663 /TAXON_ID=267565 /ORGANISM="Skeletonema grethea, Strain CCMP 1804" /LENGTH=57 /DNA_ID=CAMNT_0048189005 /DNA_START=189 /DNA_END=359 /DNA_ORIENTATION=-